MAEYLRSGMPERQSESAPRPLLRTSMLDRFSGGLADLLNSSYAMA